MKRLTDLNAFKHNLKKHYLKKLGKANFKEKLSLLISLVWLCFYIVTKIITITFTVAIIILFIIFINFNTIFLIIYLTFHVNILFTVI